MADDGIAILADARVAEEVGDILEAAVVAVDAIFALTGAVDAPRDGNLRKRHLEQAVAIVKFQSHLAIGERFSLLRAVEDDILHLRATERLCTLLAENPAHRVGDIAFPAAVRSDDGGNALPKTNLGLSGKGFKAVQFQFCQSHTSPSKTPNRINAAFAASCPALCLLSPVPSPTGSPERRTQMVNCF